jgi:hypothetical protein
VQVRALIPGGLRERAGAAESASLIATWFADSTQMNLVEWSVEDVEDRLHIWYRFAGVEEGQPYLVEQHLFCVVTADKIGSTCPYRQEDGQRERTCEAIRHPILPLSDPRSGRSFRSGGRLADAARGPMEARLKRSSIE